MKRSIILLLILFFLSIDIVAGTTSGINYQGSGTLSTEKQNGFSFRGKPKDEVNIFLITEVGIARRFNDDGLVKHIAWDIGLMVNLNSKMALGGNLYISYDDTFNKAFFYGLKLRYRYWLTNRIHWDIAPGLLLSESRPNSYSDSRFDSRTYPSFIGHTSIGFGDWFSIVIQHERVRDSFKYAPKSNWYYGISVGSYIGVVAAPISFVLVSISRSIQN